MNTEKSIRVEKGGFQKSTQEFAAEKYFHLAFDVWCENKTSANVQISRGKLFLLVWC